MLTAPGWRSCTASSPWIVSGWPFSSRTWNRGTRMRSASSSIRVVRPVNVDAGLHDAEGAVLHVDVAVEVRVACPSR